MLSFSTCGPEHRADLLEVFESNLGEYLHEDEREGYEAWLDAPQGVFRALVEDGRAIGCGGWVVDDDQTLRLTWGLLHRDHHGRRLGDLNLIDRLVTGFAETGLRASTLGTTPKVEPFFLRVGFTRTDFRRDGWGPGLDRVDLRLEATQANLDDLRARLERLWALFEPGP